MREDSKSARCVFLLLTVAWKRLLMSTFSKASDAYQQQQLYHSGSQWQKIKKLTVWLNIFLLQIHDKLTSRNTVTENLRH